MNHSETRPYESLKRVIVTAVMVLCFCPIITTQTYDWLQNCTSRKEELVTLIVYDQESSIVITSPTYDLLQYFMCNCLDSSPDW